MLKPMSDLDRRKKSLESPGLYGVSRETRARLKKKHVKTFDASRAPDGGGIQYARRPPRFERDRSFPGERFAFKY